MVVDYHRDQQHRIPWTLWEVMPVYHINALLICLVYGQKSQAAMNFEFSSKMFEVKCTFHFSIAFIIAYMFQGCVKKFHKFLLKALW